MSVAISTAAPVSTLLPSDRSEKNVETEGLEKPEQARRSAVSAGLDRIDLGKEGIAVTEVSRQQGAEPAAKRASAPSADRVEINKEGRRPSPDFRPERAAEPQRPPMTRPV